MAEPKTGALTAREAAGNASRGIRRRLAVFLRSAGRLGRGLNARRQVLLVLVPGAVAGLLMIISEFLLFRYVKTITASCSDLASPAVRDSWRAQVMASHQ